MFSIHFQRTHDIDWFATIRNIPIHAMSFGGLLPEAVNNRINNSRILMQVYRKEPVFNNLDFNDTYIIERLNLSNNQDNAREIRERYLRHFSEMASRGFYSFDRDLYEDNVYHLIVKPAHSDFLNIELPNMPKLLEDQIRFDLDDTRLVML